MATRGQGGAGAGAAQQAGANDAHQPEQEGKAVSQQGRTDQGNVGHGAAGGAQAGQQAIQGSQHDRQAEPGQAEGQFGQPGRAIGAETGLAAPPDEQRQRDYQGQGRRGVHADAQKAVAP